MIIASIIALVLSLVIIIGGLFALKKQITSSVGAERESLVAEIPKTLAEVEELLSNAGRFASKPQLEFVISQIQATQADLTKEKNSLKEIENRLDVAQKNVEQKEAAQQELKTAREEEEAQLQELLTKFEDISTESVSLEQKLAASMKNLDQLLEEVELTPDQRGAFQDLQNALTNAGAQLRDLLMEYTTVKERLQVLQQQHKDLEEEYTRLVEQQLGE